METGTVEPFDFEQFERSKGRAEAIKTEAPAITFDRVPSLANPPTRQAGENRIFALGQIGGHDRASGRVGGFIFLSKLARYGAIIISHPSQPQPGFVDVEIFYQNVRQAIERGTTIRINEPAPLALDMRIFGRSGLVLSGPDHRFRFYSASPGMGRSPTTDRP